MWRNKITLPPCFNAAQTCSSSASARPAESVSKTTKQRSEGAVRLFKLVSMGCGADGTNAAAGSPILKLTQFLGERNVRSWHKADMKLAARNVRYWGQSGHRPDSPLLRKPDPERRAAVISIFCPYQPVVRLDNGARDGQPHAHAFRLAGEERFEDLFNLSSGMPDPRSDTDSSAKFSTREVRMLMMRFSVGVSFIASIPFTTRFTMTC